MSRIDAVFQTLKGETRVALMPFLTAGDPSFDLTARFILEMEKNGADIIELGIPFSDPLADGPTIQRSAQRALAGGISLAGILDFLKRLREKTRIPIVLMGYYNPIFHYGVQRFVEDAQAVGVDGVIVPDLPPEEAEDLMGAAKKKGLDTIFLLAPTSTPERIKKIAEVSQGFIYYVSLTGVTGARSELSGGIAESIGKIREVTSKPICVGFGISSPHHVRSVRHFVDGVIVGSAVVQQIEKVSEMSDGPAQIGDFIRELREAADESD